MREEIKDYNGTIIAVVESDSSGNEVLKTYKGEILGKYNSNRNITQTYKGVIVSQGNTLTHLIK